MTYVKSRKHSPARQLPGRAAAGATATIMALGAPFSAFAQSNLPEVRVEAESDFKVDKSSSNKFTAPLLDTPKSVTVIPQELIRQTGVTNLADALRAVPGITFGAGEGGNPVGDRPFIRGFDSQTDTYVDGLRDAASQTREIFNVESIEVIKGPSSVFGGRGSAGGAVNIISKAPQADNFLSGTVGLGTNAFRRTTLDLNRVLSDGVAARLNLLDFSRDIAGRGPVNEKRWGVAPSVTFGLDSPTKLTLGYYHYQSNDLPDSGVPYDNPFAATSPNAWRNGSGQPLRVPRDSYYGLVDRDYQKTQVDAGTVDFSHDFGQSLVLRNILRHTQSSNSYIWSQPDDSRGNFLLNGTVWRRPNNRDAHSEALANQTSLSGKLDAAGIRHSYTAGVEFGDEKTHRTGYLFQDRLGAPFQNYPRSGITGANCAVGAGAASGYNCTTLLNPNPFDPWSGVVSPSPAENRIKTRTQAVYAFDTLQFNEQWSANLGLRWDNYETRMVQPSYRTPIAVNAAIPDGTLLGSTTRSIAAGGTVPTLALENKSRFINYQAGLVYKPAPNGSVYVSMGSASTPPGTDAGDGSDGLSAAIRNLKPQDSTSVELGTKWEVLDRRLMLSSAVFQTRMNNARVVAADGTSQNVGKKDVKGFEVDVAGSLTTRWQVFGGYTYLDATLKDNGFVASGGSFVASPSNGNAFPNVSRHSASLWTTYLLMPGLTLGGGAAYVGRQYGNVTNTKWIPSYVKYDAMLSYAVNKNFSLQLNIDNLTNRYYFSKAYASHYASVGPGRSTWLTGSFTF